MLHVPNAWICMSSYYTVTFLFVFQVVVKSPALTCKMTLTPQHVSSST